ncbi:MAG TPA: SEC-C metal-binding domain-containing protein [Acidimicrobiales bacterium]|jgi:hypothetical protein|nr:SEC-C metal-binding domain-containing protein [Acidimicrobiales bacterium]
MPQRGRTQRCICGSGKKVKRCCGVTAHLGPAELAKMELVELTRSLAPTLARCTDGELHDLLDLVPGLADLDVSLAWCLPRTLPSEIQHLRTAIHDDDLEAVKAALPGAVAALDDQVGRARLAHAVLALRDIGRIEKTLAAAAVVDLASGSPQLVTASIVEAVLLDVGVNAVPARLFLTRF